MIQPTFTVTGVINGAHAKTGEIIYWEREVYARNGSACVVKSYINLRLHITATFSKRDDADRFEAFMAEVMTPYADTPESTAA